MKTLFRRTLLSAALAVAALPAVAQSTPDSPFTQTVFFGDSLTDGGYTTSLELESKLPEDTLGDLYEEGTGDYTGIIAYYRDAKTGTEKTITAGDQAKPRRLRYLYSEKATAKRAVDREWAKMQESKT